MKKQNKKGFSLLELILVLGVGSMMAFMRFQDMKTEQENVMAKAVGQQMKQIGEAVNGYINIRYDKLSTLTSSSSQSSYPGPRTCNGSGCEITYQTLINEGLLPVSYTGVNAQKSSYKIMLKRSGATPNYVVNGLITTTLPWSESGKLRYDLLGKAMQEAGIDSGMTRTTSNAFGYGGQWSETSANFNNITSAGQLAFRVGFNSALYSVYLRRDGTLPMTGNLNMGGQSVYNAQDITAAGTTTTGILETNTATVGATLNVAGVTTLASDLNVSGNGQVNGNLNSNKTLSGATVTSRSETYTQNWFRTLGDGGIYFQKYGGGWNMGDTATINAYGGKNVQTSAGFYGGYIKSTGNIDANGRVNAGEFIYINGQANVGWGCSPNGLQGRTPEGAILSCVNGVWKSSSARIERTQFLVSSGSNYGDICQSNINSNGMAAQGWVASGSDACTEDGNNCSVDNVRCFAIRIVN
ncbi:TPA: shufflon system plasmid conjugative transfer pilus tip adhesin PilV [Enterobacter hormaechei subsp. hoffmannii]|uniref:shufflon system plasmid conjugative transfer pilus tip adhesin PilV n=1 Tax=Enterobacter cloacae complex TaxID=354276 RepID=UPI00123BD1A7|nr:MULTISPECIES: shufflon system plasmid conjugative transfer pilus tip adhesin PilV [Enterobacter cloacae complex]HED1448765.1 shufflon system plasmid conjugative transfer pilus tip adhesin PilV [Enterobacter hormaechei subsp. steigerwaltii]MBJ6588528.1 shufflon system plasmid conjugative transfer pilus tip adhesin PilV [Enterobacter asburiae]HED1261004.1 shufflon system plasmid conjugative transfer pilus tip adhesin PilV [Enterobacter hormaechei subsp. hoffmannii]HED1262737.1 shufflon system 